MLQVRECIYCLPFPPVIFLQSLHKYPPFPTSILPLSILIVTDFLYSIYFLSVTPSPCLTVHPSFIWSSLSTISPVLSLPLFSLAPFIFVFVSRSFPLPLHLFLSPPFTPLECWSWYVYMFGCISICREVEDLAESMRLSERKLSVCRKMLMEVILPIMMHGNRDDVTIYPRLHFYF